MNYTLNIESRFSPHPNFVAYAEAQSFPDVPSSHQNYDSISWLAKEGIIQGYEDGTFKPDNPVNRAELMKMVVMMKAAIDDNYNKCFPDVTDDWYARYVCYGLEQGWIKGYPDGNFLPANNVNRAEAVKVTLNAMIPEDEWPELNSIEELYLMPADLDMDAWYANHLQMALVKDFLDKAHTTENPEGTINYFPSGEMTRKEVAEMIYSIQHQ